VLSEFVQQLSDLLDGLEVDVGVQFGQGSDDGLNQVLMNFLLTFNKASWEVFSFNLVRTLSYLLFS
jgi:hypothetical protein